MASSHWFNYLTLGDWVTDYLELLTDWVDWLDWVDGVDWVERVDCVDCGVDCIDSQTISQLVVPTIA